MAQVAPKKAVQAGVVRSGTTERENATEDRMVGRLEVLGLLEARVSSDHVHSLIRSNSSDISAFRRLPALRFKPFGSMDAYLNLYPKKGRLPPEGERGL